VGPPCPPLVIAANSCRSFDRSFLSPGSVSRTKCFSTATAATTAPRSTRSSLLPIDPVEACPLSSTSVVQEVRAILCSQLLILLIT
jgi:hypothetical protein